MPIESVVVNLSPLITLYSSQLVNLLPELFSTIQVPPAVWREVTAYKVDVAAQSLPQANWATRLETVTIHPSVAAWDLGSGETEVLSFALVHPNYTAVIDDAAARRCAISLNIPTLGTAGMVVLAKRRGLIPSISGPIQALRNAGLWLADDLVQLLKKQAGEA